MWGTKSNWGENANDNHVSLNRFYKLFISLASLDAWQFSLWTSMSFILVLLSQTPLENDWYSYQLRTICSLLDNSNSVLSLSTSCFSPFSHIFSIACILFSVNRRQSTPEELSFWIHFFPSGIGILNCCLFPFRVLIIYM